MHEPKNKLVNVFVFGTLKQGFPNFHLNKGKKHGGLFITQKNYLFYLVGERHSPCLYEQDSKGEPITGELYSVNEDQLAVLDKLERTDEESGYQRTLIGIKDKQNNSLLKAFIYLKMAAQIKPSSIKVGPIHTYSQEHTKLYLPRKSSV